MTRMPWRTLLAVLAGASLALTPVAAVATTGTTAAVAAAVTSAVVDPPPEYGPSWDDPRTPEQPVAVPDSRHCTVRIVDHGFDNFDVYSRHFTPPAGCPGTWSKVVMRLTGSVAGRQFDRLGYLDVGGVRMLTLSTPEPSESGISWHVDKDVTALAPVLRSPTDVTMFIGNVVDGTYTGVLAVTVDLDFYVTGPKAPAAVTAAQVLPLAGATRDDSDLVGTLTVPRNTTKLLADVYATGSGGGCEEFWDTSAPADSGYSCADGLPYREVDVSIDGRVAGVALPYPVIYTGGWSNPFLWYTVPSPRAFDIPSLRYDLTPFVGGLTDGKAHDIRISVQGLPAGQSGWTLAPLFSLWRDAGTDRVTGATTRYAAPPAHGNAAMGNGGGGGSLGLRVDRTFGATGYLDTSLGRVTTSVDRSLHNTSQHRWTAGEADDRLEAAWRDATTVVTTPARGPVAVATEELRYAKKGVLGFVPHPGIDGAFDVTGDLAITWGGITRQQTGGRTLLERDVADTYSGTASWIYGVPREERHAHADTTARDTVAAGPGTAAYIHRMQAVNGVFVLDRETGE